MDVVSWLLVKGKGIVVEAWQMMKGFFQ